jgi:hypothetical protein
MVQEAMVDAVLSGGAGGGEVFYDDADGGEDCDVSGWDDGVHLSRKEQQRVDSETFGGGRYRPISYVPLLELMYLNCQR